MTKEREIDKNRPCYGCTKETGRRESCHDSCDLYIEWKERREVVKKKSRNEMQTWGYIKDMQEKIRRRG